MSLEWICLTYIPIDSCLLHHWWITPSQLGRFVMFFLCVLGVSNWSRFIFMLHVCSYYLTVKTRGAVNISIWFFREYKASPFVIGLIKSSKHIKKKKTTWRKPSFHCKRLVTSISLGGFLRNMEQSPITGSWCCQGTLLGCQDCSKMIDWIPLRL